MRMLIVDEHGALVGFTRLKHLRRTYGAHGPGPARETRREHAGRRVVLFVLGERRRGEE